MLLDSDHNVEKKDLLTPLEHIIDHLACCIILAEHLSSSPLKTLIYATFEETQKIPLELMEHQDQAEISL